MSPKTLKWIIAGLAALCIFLGYYALQWYEFSRFEVRYNRRAQNFGKWMDSVHAKRSEEHHWAPEAEEDLEDYVHYYDTTCPDRKSSDTICSDCICMDTTCQGNGDSCRGRLRSVWVDDTTVLNLAHFMFCHRSTNMKADGIRIYIERYPDTIPNPRGGVFLKNSYNMALVMTRDSAGNHVDWCAHRKKGELNTTFLRELVASDEPAADNYNNPCPPDTTNCRNTIGVGK